MKRNPTTRVRILLKDRSSHESTPNSRPARLRTVMDREDILGTVRSGAHILRMPTIKRAADNPERSISRNILIARLIKGLYEIIYHKPSVPSTPLIQRSGK
jgi:hypothetical protein